MTFNQGVPGSIPGWVTIITLQLTVYVASTFTAFNTVNCKFLFAPVAQLDRAIASDAMCHAFESHRAYQRNKTALLCRVVLLRAMGFAAALRRLRNLIAGLRFSLALLLVVFCMLVALCATSLLDADCAVNLITTNVLPAVNGENALYTVNLFSNIFYALSALPNLSIKSKSVSLI